MEDNRILTPEEQANCRNHDGSGLFNIEKLLQEQDKKTAHLVAVRIFQFWDRDNRVFTYPRENLKKEFGINE
jgi:hypothetical protein